MDHLGVEVADTAQVTAATERLKEAGLATFEENDSCCDHRSGPVDKVQRRSFGLQHAVGQNRAGMAADQAPPGATARPRRHRGP